VEETGIVLTTVNQAPGQLQPLGIVKELTARERSRLFYNQ